MSWKEQAESGNFSYETKKSDDTLEKETMEKWNLRWNLLHSKTGPTYFFAYRKNDKSYQYLYTYRITLFSETLFFAEQGYYYKPLGEEFVTYIKSERWTGTYQKTDSGITFTNTKKGKLNGLLSTRIEEDIFEDTSSWTVKATNDQIEWANQTLRLASPDAVQTNLWDLPPIVEAPKQHTYQEEKQQYAPKAPVKVMWNAEKKNVGKSYKFTENKVENGQEIVDSYRITLLAQSKFYAEHVFTSKDAGTDKKPAIKDERWVGTYTKTGNNLTFKTTATYTLTCSQLDDPDDEYLAKGTKEEKADDSTWTLEEVKGKVTWQNRVLQ